MEPTILSSSGHHILARHSSMSASAFRSFHASFDATGLGAVFAPRKPRHPLLRVAVGLLGLALLAGLLVVGVFVGAAMLAAGLLRRLWSQRNAPRVHPVMEADYRVVRKPALRHAR
jgi:hypothetical protein